MPASGSTLRAIAARTQNTRHQPSTRTSTQPQTTPSSTRSSDEPSAESLENVSTCVTSILLNDDGPDTDAGDNGPWKSGRDVDERSAGVYLQDPPNELTIGDVLPEVQNILATHPRRQCLAQSAVPLTSE